MALPTVNDVGAVDPVLTNMLVGYMQADDRFVASRVFPEVQVGNDSGTYYIMTKKYWFLDALKVRAPGTGFAPVPIGVSTSTYTTIQYAGGFVIPDEVRANSQVPTDLFSANLQAVAQASLIRKEVAFGADFMALSVWGTDDNNATTDWDDFSAGDPVSDFLTASRTISNNTGVRANTAVMGGIVWDALVNHPDIIDRIKYTQTATIGGVDNALSAALGVNILVSWASYTNTNEAQTFSASAILDDDCLICYVNPNAGIMDATAGKTFTWAGGGGAGTIYRDPDRWNHGDYAQHKEQWDQKAVATDAGYFFSNVV